MKRLFEDNLPDRVYNPNPQTSRPRKNRGIPRVARAGDLWVFGGRHRLLCGDAGDKSRMDRLFQKELFDLLFTSPPYLFKRNYKNSFDDRDKLMNSVFGQAFIKAKKDSQILVNLGLCYKDGEWYSYWDNWVEFMRSQGWRRFALNVWDQGFGLPGEWAGRLNPSFEFVFHFNRQTKLANKWIRTMAREGEYYPFRASLSNADGNIDSFTHGGMPRQLYKKPDNVIRVNRDLARGLQSEHPAVFPLALPEFIMRTYAKEGDIIYEPFAGSGTSILAAENVGVRCFAMEISPEYVDIALARWQHLGGHLWEDASLKLDPGLTYKEVLKQRENKSLTAKEKPGKIPRSDD